MGFLDKVNVELKERGRTLTPGSRWGPFETMTVGRLPPGGRPCTSTRTLRMPSTWRDQRLMIRSSRWPSMNGNTAPATAKP